MQMSIITRPRRQHHIINHFDLVRSGNCGFAMLNLPSEPIRRADALLAFDVPSGKSLAVQVCPPLWMRTVPKDHLRMGADDMSGQTTVQRSGINRPKQCSQN